MGRARLASLDTERALAMLRRVPVLIRSVSPRANQVSLRTIQRRAERMLRALSLEHAELSLLLCGARTMRALNKRHRGLDRSTDVLSFGLQESRGPQLANAVLGDIVISLPDALRQAKANDRDPLAEVTMLLAHGLLHLLGLDHRTRLEERRMLARTDALIAAATTTRQKPAVDRSLEALRRRRRFDLGRVGKFRK